MVSRKLPCLKSQKTFDSAGGRNLSGYPRDFIRVNARMAAKLITCKWDPSTILDGDKDGD
jgi:hypothetical protein